MYISEWFLSMTELEGSEKSRVWIPGFAAVRVEGF
jgi:hypothetical protein